LLSDIFSRDENDEKLSKRKKPIIFFVEEDKKKFLLELKQKKSIKIFGYVFKKLHVFDNDSKNLTKKK
jgi:hypothetical protein